MKYLISIAIGPVQEFIITARRSRDLWFGSWLLSELSKTAAHCIAEDHGVNALIFPAPHHENDLHAGSNFDAPNKIVALIESVPNEVQTLGLRAEQAVKSRLKEIAKEAYRGRVRGRIDDDKAIAQVEDMVECFWAFSPVSESGYGVARERLESIMAARKATRLFKPTDPWKAPVPKSSLDGQRESVIPEDAYPAIRLPKARRLEQLRRLRLDYGVRNGERLCGVGLLKRHGARDKEQRCFSTSHVAARPLMDRLTPVHQLTFDAYVNALKSLLDDTYGGDADYLELLGNVPGPEHAILNRYDGHILFEERLSDLFPNEDKNRLEMARKELKRFLDSIEKGIRPLPYYALLIADGDWMGAAIRGQKKPKDHRRLSEALSQFASDVRKIVQRHSGSLCYAGGDDVLAFVPVHTVLKCSRCLVKSFNDKLKEFAFKTTETNKTESSTLSVGVAVSHHLEPLSDALILARQAEKSAKQVPGKNALAIVLSKRSGADRTVAGKWGVLDVRIESFIDLHRKDAIPDGAAYELRDLAIKLHVSKTDRVHHDILIEAMRTEAVRILGRKQPRGNIEGITESDLRRLEEMILTPGELATLYPRDRKDEPANSSSPIAKNSDSEQPALDVAQLADELIIARIFADAESLASPVNAPKEDR